MPGTFTRLVVAALAALILVSDIAQDLSWWSDPARRSAGLAVAMAVRNGLLAVGLVGFGWGRTWGALCMLASAALGLLRRGLFLGAPMGVVPLAQLPADPGFQLIHAGFDLAFRLLVLALVVDWLRGLRRR